MSGDKNLATIAIYDTQVRTAWIKQVLSDGTKLRLGRTNEEQMFVVTLAGTYAVVAKRAGWYKCADGSQARATVTNMNVIIPNAGGHTHPLGRNSDILADMPGPEDGRMAEATVTLLMSSVVDARSRSPKPVLTRLM